MLPMIHPDIEAPAEALDKATYQQVWAPRGWLLMDEPTAYANQALGKFVRTPENLTKDEARALVAARGGDYPDEDATGADAVAAYLATFGARPAAPTPVVQSPAGIALKPYDPGEHPVNPNDSGDRGVLAYLDEADDDERQRVLEMEEAGQGRVTILNWSPPDETDSAPADNAGQE